MSSSWPLFFYFYFFFNLWQRRTDCDPRMHLGHVRLPFSISFPSPDSHSPREHVKCQLSVLRARTRRPPHRARGGPARGGAGRPQRTVLRDHPVRKSPFLFSCHLSTGTGCPPPSLMGPGLGAVTAGGSHHGAAEDWCLALRGRERQGDTQWDRNLPECLLSQVFEGEGDAETGGKKVLRAEAGAG